jgi:hypothetical protein
VVVKMKTMVCRRDEITHYPIAFMKGEVRQVPPEDLVSLAAVSDDVAIVEAKIEPHPSHSGAAVLTLIPSAKRRRKKHAIVSFGTCDEQHQIMVKVVDD